MDFAANEITMNGVVYVRKDSLAEPAPTGQRAIVVVDRGWVFCGDVDTEHESVTGRVRLSDAVHVLRWNSIGFDGLVAESDKSKIVTGKLTSAVDVPAAAELFRVPVHGAWGK